LLGSSCRWHRLEAAMNRLETCSAPQRHQLLILSATRDHITLGTTQTIRVPQVPVSPLTTHTNRLIQHHIGWRTRREPSIPWHNVGSSLFKESKSLGFVCNKPF